jgi:hypothetical protein
MLVPVKPEPDFSQGRALLTIADSFLAIHPHAVREWFYASTVLGDTRRSESLFTAPTSCTWR